MDNKLISGEKLKLLLKKKGIKQTDLVKITGVAQEQISRYYNDRNEMPASFIIKVAFYAGLNVSDLIEGHKYHKDVDHKEVAAEPKAIYTPIPKDILPEPPQEIPKSDLVTIDVTRLTEIIDKLRTQLENVEQTVMDLKDGKFTLNQ
jgi:transcriptional regulator with XRE-family HTH domain